MSATPSAAELGALRFLAGLSEPHLAHLADVAERVAVDGDTVLFAEGDARRYLLVVEHGSIAIEHGTQQRATRIATFGAGDPVGEGVLLDDDVHGNTARTLRRTTLVRFPIERLDALLTSEPALYAALVSRAARAIARRLRAADATLVGRGRTLGFLTGHTRLEHDLLGDREVPDEALYGVQTLRALENFPITGVPLRDFPLLIEALAAVKEAAAMANRDLGLLEPGVADAIVRAAREVRAGRHHEHFPRRA